MSDSKYFTTTKKGEIFELKSELNNDKKEKKKEAVKKVIVQKCPDILKHEMKVFFVKYNDLSHVKLGKLDIMIRLASQANIAQAVRAIGRCAIKVEPSAERCVSTLLDLIQTKVNYVVQEAIVVIKDIFRKYPNKYESIISTLYENLDKLDKPADADDYSRVSWKVFMMKIHNLATQDSDNPDLRDRGFIYWRLLSRDPTGK
ncbi:hypothetical protein PV328_000291 [Microctonus aethiopoides]|uniref:Clathrin/coatomer adaptor adaptin-like N-terminal domain-containing protein n=1 Tax=Microctonus aethiopoides TaxID=144406 RepID=A0AA39KW45_9HYME|nr:hypothetical protein PV328_000291 [Microctonus aethiopoides]